MDFDQDAASTIVDSDNDNASENLVTTGDIAESLPVTSDGELVINGFVFTPTGLVPRDPSNPPDFEDWDRTGVFLRYIHTGTQFWLGDWLNYGESNYGERYAQAVDHTGYELHTLQTYAWVARQVPRSNRLEAVPFGHYANGIAALPPDQQAEWAHKVASEGMSQSELKSALAKKRADAGAKPVDLWLIVKCKDQRDFDKLEKQMRDQGREVTSRTTVQRTPKADKPAKATKAAKTAKARTKAPQAPPVPEPAAAMKDEQPIEFERDDPETDKGWLRDEFYFPGPPNETPADRAKRRKKITNARFRAKAKA